MAGVADQLVTHPHPQHHSDHHRLPADLLAGGGAKVPAGVVVLVDVIDRVPGLGPRAAALRQRMADARLRARTWTREHGEDIPEVAQWTWPG
jgi:hypothetical protein